MYINLSLFAKAEYLSLFKTPFSLRRWFYIFFFSGLYWLMWLLVACGRMLDHVFFPGYKQQPVRQLTAMSIAQLIDDGKLEWDKAVREYMPEFILNEAYVTQHVTVRDMLCHRTGLPRHDFSAWRLDISRAEFIKRMKHFKFNATFREKFQYNNLMYYAIAYLVEKISGQKWEDFIQQRIFSPLKMSASNFKPEPPEAGQFTAKGYRVDRDMDGSAKGLINMPFGLHTELSPGSAGTLAAGVGATVFYWPTVPDVWVKDVWGVEETAHEGMGVMVGLVVLIVVLLTSLLRKPAA